MADFSGRLTVFGRELVFERRFVGWVCRVNGYTLVLITGRSGEISLRLTDHYGFAYLPEDAARKLENSLRPLAELLAPLVKDK